MTTATAAATQQRNKTLSSHLAVRVMGIHSIREEASRVNKNKAGTHGLLTLDLRRRQLATATRVTEDSMTLKKYEGTDTR